MIIKIDLHTVISKKRTAIIETIKKRGFRYCQKCGTYKHKQVIGDNGFCFDCNL